MSFGKGNGRRAGGPSSGLPFALRYRRANRDLAEAGGDRACLDTAARTLTGGRSWIANVVVLFCCLLLAACAGAGTRPGDLATPPDAPALTPAPDAVDYACKTDADCAVKDVGNCCGYYPACVNTNSATFPDKVKADCAREGRMAICGFPEIRGCACVEGRCESVLGSAEEVQ